MAEVKCRLCDFKTDNGIEIFGKQGIKLSISSILLQRFNILSLDEDTHSRVVCKKCWRITDQFHKLYCQVERNNTDQFDVAGTINKEATEIVVTPALDNIKEESFLNESYSQFNCNDSTFDDKISIFKTEEDNLDMENVDFPNTSILEAMFVKSNDGNVSKKIKSKLASRATRKNPSKTINKYRTDKSTVKLNIIEQDNEIMKFLGIFCEICDITMNTFTSLMNHYRTEHRIDGYLKCCNRKFLRRHRLYKHIQNHGCPDRYKCDTCGKSYLDKDYYHRHIRRHDPSTKSFQCTKCPKRFDCQKYLDLHFLRTHSDGPKPFICDICNKGFITKYSVATHLLSMHTEHYSFICDNCGKVFKSRVQLDIHYNSNHMGIVIPKVQCTLCGAWLSNKKCLKSHIRRHEAVKEVCTTCGKVCPNRDALSKHFRYAHSVVSYRCHMCDKTCKSQIALKEHISIHTGFSLYKCSYCSMEFKSNANMYKHRKSSHPIEWQQDRGKRLNIYNV